MLQLYLRHGIYNILFNIKQGQPPPPRKNFDCAPATARHLPLLFAT